MIEAKMGQKLGGLVKLICRNQKKPVAKKVLCPRPPCPWPCPGTCQQRPCQPVLRQLPFVACHATCKAALQPFPSQNAQNCKTGGR